MDIFAQFKEVQKQGWAHFAPLEAITTPAAVHLIKHAGLQAGQHILDVACGTGVVAVTAARAGAHVTGLDLTPELLDRARTNGQIANVNISWQEGDAEFLPCADASFDIVLSQFGHMFAPRPEVAVAEMLRVLKPGGTIAFSTWPPELMVGSTLALVARYLPPPPWLVSPTLWGDPNIVRERLGTAVTNVVFDLGRMLVPALSPAHNRMTFERSAGPVRKLVESLGDTDPARLAEFRKEYENLVTRYFADNFVHQDYLMTRATKI
jgi:2-polyprenyl-3-methyl-5-hydroxy-6-metoxy-1,4-benzoquinol methylase